jgi:hypothetical protein
MDAGIEPRTVATGAYFCAWFYFKYMYKHEYLVFLSRSEDEAECICEECGGLVRRVDLQHCVESVLAGLHSLKFLRGDSAAEHLRKAQAIYTRWETDIICFLNNPDNSNLFISGLVSQDKECVTLITF